MRQKYKALCVYRDEIVKDVNHESWAKIKKHIIDIPDDTKVQPSSITVTYDTVVGDANFASYKLTKQRIIENTSNDINESNAVSLLHNDVLNEANLIAFRDGKNWISVASKEQATSIELNFHNIKDDANLEAFKVDKKHILEGAVASTLSGNADISLDDITKYINEISLTHTQREVVTEETSSSFAVDIDNIKQRVDAVSWKVAQCRLDDAEKRFDVQSDDSAQDANFVSYAISKALANLASRLPSTSINGSTIEMKNGWKGSASVFGEMVKKYVAEFVTSEWFKIVMPSEASVYLAEAENTLTRLVEGASNGSWVEGRVNAYVDELKSILGIHLTGYSYTDKVHTLNLAFSSCWTGNIDVFRNLLLSYVSDSILNEWFKIAAPAVTAYNGDRWLQLIDQEIKKDDEASLWYANAQANAVANLQGAFGIYASYENDIFILNFKDEWRGNVDALKGYMHQYVLDFILHRWFLSTNTQQASLHLQLSQEWLAKINEEIIRTEDASDWFNSTIDAVTAIIKDDIRPLLCLYSDTPETPVANQTTFNLSLSASWRGSIDSVREYIKQFAVYYTLGQWFTITDADKAAKYNEQATLWKERLVKEAFSEDENSEWLAGIYASAIEQLNDNLRFCIFLSDTDSTTKNHTFNFRFSKAWRGSISSLSNYIHHFVVDYILNEWFALIAPEQVSKYTDKIDKWNVKLLDEAHSEEENFDWFERQLATAVENIKDRLRWCLNPCEHLGTIVDDTIKKRAIAYGEDGNPPVENDPNSFTDDEAFLDAPAEVYVPVPEYIFRFKFSNVWKGNFEALGNYIHRYIVDFILYEWFKISLPSEAAVYLASAEKWKDKIVNEARSEDVRNVFFRL